MKSKIVAVDDAQLANNAVTTTEGKDMGQADLQVANDPPALAANGAPAPATPEPKAEEKKKDWKGKL